MPEYDPLRLPAPIGYGYDSTGGRAPISANHAYGMGEIPDPQRLTSPEDAQRRVENYHQPIRLPDAVRASISPGDKQVVGELLKIVNSEASELQVGPDIARQLLDKWGYPHDPDAWTYDEWQAAIDAHALDPQIPAIGY